MRIENNTSAPVIDWDSAPEGFPVWIEDLIPFGESTSCWAKDAGNHYLGVNGSKWDKPEGIDFSAHRRTQSIAEIMDGADRAVFGRAYVVKDCSPVMAEALLEQLRCSKADQNRSSVVLMTPAPVEVDFQSSISVLDPSSVAVDWSEAPEGATHRVPGGCWYKFDADADTLSCWLLGGWSESPAENYERAGSVFLSMIARPTGPAEKWSLDGKDGTWDYDTLAELIIDCYGHDSDGDGHPASFRSGLYEGDTIYRAIEHKDDPADFLPDAGQITETMWDKAAMSDAGEWVDDFPALDDDSIAALELALEPLKAWARKHCQPDFFTVKDITPYILTVEDVCAAKAQERGQ